MAKEHRVMWIIIVALLGIFLCCSIFYWTQWPKGWVILFFIIWAGLMYFCF